MTLRLADTAGLRETADVVEQMGVNRAEAEIRDADLVLAVFDPTEGIGAEEREMMNAYPDCPRIAVLNKADTGACFSEEDLTRIRRNHDATVSLSCGTGEGMEALAAQVASLWGSDRLVVGRDAVIWDVRQHAALSRAEMYLSEAAAALAYGDEIDAVCTVVESALAALDETDGRLVNGEIVDAIFQRFCVGK